MNMLTSPSKKTNFFQVLLTICVVLLAQFNVKSQSNVVLCLGQDATICPVQTVTINDCGNVGGGSAAGSAQYIASNIPYAPDPFNIGTPITLSDDAVSPVQNIGFSFCFFGNSYTQFYVSSNGWVGFSAGQPTTFTSAVIPSAAIDIPKNCIMGPWQDWHPGLGLGPYIRYQVLGTSPNRRLVISWNNCPMFSCTSTFGTFQIVIFETSNNIETRIQNKPNCLTWAGGTAVHGIHNLAGTQAIVVPGRNSTQWTTTNNAWRFTPQVTWGNTLGQTFPYNGGVLNVNPVPPGTTGYFLKTGCSASGTGNAISDTTWITVANPTVTTTTLPDICAQGVGSATAVPGLGVTLPCTYTWTPSNQNGVTISNLFAGTYNVSLLDANGCTATGSATIVNNPASFTGTTTPVSCPGGSDGTATANVTPVTGPITFEWSNGQTTQTATGLSAGNYWCYASTASGCFDSIYVTVTEIPAMVLTMTNIVDANCYTFANGQATVNVTQGTPNYTYSWTGSTASAATALDLGVGIHTVTVTDLNGCTKTLNVTINEPLPLDITYITPDSMICSEDAIILTVNGTGGSTAYTYSWTQDGLPIGNGSSISVDPANSGTVYCVTLSEACGSPINTECMTITFPLGIVPNTIPDFSQRCLPGDFIFTNMSTNGAEVATTQYIFSNGESFTVNGLDPLAHTLPLPGTYTVDLIVTSNYGCLYYGHFQDIVEVTPLPRADFTMSKSPLTWFETTVQTNDISTGNIANYSWFSPGATNLVNNGGSAMISYPEGVMGTYDITLVVTTTLGCSDSVTYPISVVSDVIFYAPTAFTPDDDEHNQVWMFYVEGIDKANFELTIHNRWGEVVWETHDVNSFWDGYYNGQKVQPGIYSWKAWYKELDTDGKTEKSGVINVIR